MGARSPRNRRRTRPIATPTSSATAPTTITGITITAQKGQVIAPPPEGASYLGFMFARTDNPFAAEGALRNALRRLHFQIRPEYPAVRTSAAARL